MILDRAWREEHARAGDAALAAARANIPPAGPLDARQAQAGAALVTAYAAMAQAHYAAANVRARAIADAAPL